MGSDVERVTLGFGVACANANDWEAIRSWFEDRHLSSSIVFNPPQWRGPGNYSCRLQDVWQQKWVPNFDTTGLGRVLEASDHDDAWRLDQEILIALLASPIEMQFPSVAEMQSSVRVRRYIAQASAKTALAFDTEAAERPVDAWTYDETLGFTILPGVDMIAALRKATQPEVSGHLYSFSCYRATEYVILLGIAQELVACNMALYNKLQRQCERRVIRSGQFHDVFLREYGSQSEPVASHYYIPGDRVWFRNPDEASSDVTGFEGSWVFYMGGGWFSNFWKRNRPFSINDKALEIFHWRHGLVKNAAGENCMDEVEVERRVAMTNANPAERQTVLHKMLQLRAAKGIYDQGGCIDTTRESPRWICEETADLVLPKESEND
jgi:Protein-glutamine gamma-glutamyltransferase